ncbi:MAG: PLP-dependent aminotransferase family protein [Anaerolineae bacterium]|nr:PLP-dependent aminotransferase family protein [Anaerolineae bacterium]
MPTKPFLISILPLDRAQPTPLYLQLYEGVRRAIINRQLTPGSSLPSTRDIAALLDISRNTVVNAFQQLIAEGYLETREKSSTFVNRDLPETLLSAPKISGIAHPSPEKPALSKHGQMMATAKAHQARKGNKHNIFTNGVPALDLFPFDIWTRLIARHYRYAPLSLFDETVSPQGYLPLREALANHLRTARAVKCDAEQIIITSGSQQAFFLAAAMLLDPGDKVWMEDPGCMGPRAAFISHRADLVTIPVDEEGLNIEVGIELAPNARVAYVNPSRQYPLGVTLSLARRLKLLEWAARANAWIIEDDYDSEFRYSGRPLASLQGLDTTGRVIYIGTMSKIMFPALRIGYIIVPRELVAAFTAARGAMDKYPPMINQLALHEFMTEGHFNRHLRRMRAVYDERRGLCEDALNAELGGLIQLGTSDAGMHICGYLPPHMDDFAVAEAAEQHGIEVLPLSEFYLGPTQQHGLILGYTGISPDYIRVGVQTLAKVLEQFV